MRGNRVVLKLVAGKQVYVARRCMICRSKFPVDSYTVIVKFTRLLTLAHGIFVYRAVLVAICKFMIMSNPRRRAVCYTKTINVATCNL